MTALARNNATPRDWYPSSEVSAPKGTHSKTTYFVVINTEPLSGTPSNQWTKALRLLATLAEESPGYLGYEVSQNGVGQEYAVTHWAAPEYIAQWKKSCHLLEGDKGLLDRLFGKEGCIWPWMSEKQA